MPQYANLRLWIRTLASLRDLATKIASQPFHTRCEDQHIDLGIILSTTIKSSVHLGLQYEENLVAYRNTNFEELQMLFDITLRLIVEQSFEILNVSTMIYTFSPWMRSTCP